MIPRGSQNMLASGMGRCGQERAGVGKGEVMLASGLCLHRALCV